jgi:hypothetical protein
MPLRKETLGTARQFEDGTVGFLGPIDHTISIPVDLTQFTNKEIDDDGYLKPYIPLDRAGAMIGGSPAFVFGVTVERRKVADDNATDTIAALGTEDIAVALICCVVRDIAEDVLDRAYTANELAGFDRAGSKSVLVDV